MHSPAGIPSLHACIAVIECAVATAFLQAQPHQLVMPEPIVLNVAGWMLQALGNRSAHHKYRLNRRVGGSGCSSDAGKQSSGDGSSSSGGGVAAAALTAGKQ